MDVEIVEGSEQFAIRIAAVTLPVGQKGAYALSVVFTKASDMDTLRVQFGDKLNESEMNRLNTFTSLNDFILHQAVRTSGSDALRSVCEKIVAEFDNIALEQVRKEQLIPADSTRGLQLENNSLIAWTYAHTNGGVYVSRIGKTREISATEVPSVRKAAFERRDQLFKQTREELMGRTETRK